MSKSAFQNRLPHKLAGICASLFAVTLFAGTVSDRVKESGVLRACIWPDYYSITYRSPRDQKLSGIDIELSAELARDLGVKLEYVDSSFAKLIEDVTNDRCDIAMFGVGITPQRIQKLAFSLPYLQSDIYGITTRSNRVIKTWSDIDRPGVRVAVQAGTFMEPVMAEKLKQARMVVIRPPETREAELEAGRVDVFMTDYPYSRRLMENADWARLVSPTSSFHPIHYAYAVKQGDEDWMARVNDFVTRIKKDGRLMKAARNANLNEIVISK